MNHFNYFTDIEETFIRRRGKHLLLSPLDWALIESWQERGVPLKIVLRGIDNVFDGVEKNPNRVRTIKSLMYCKEEIEAQYAEWLETQVGKGQKRASQVEKEKSEKNMVRETKKDEKESSLFSKETIENHLHNIINSLDRSKAKSNVEMRQVLEEVKSNLNKYQKNYKDTESLEDRLNHFEKKIDETLFKTSNKKLIDRLKKEIEESLAKHKGRMEKDVYKRTFDLMLAKALREEFEIPSFSLFYL